MLRLLASIEIHNYLTLSEININYVAVKKTPLGHVYIIDRVILLTTIILFTTNLNHEHF